MRIDTSKLTEWKIATKTKNIKAKPLISILVDRNVMNKFLLDTLEGKEVLGDGSVVCIGETGDTWQQMPKKLLQKYDIKGIDKDGWMECEPYPDNAVNVIEVHGGLTFPDQSFTIIGQWGAVVNGEKNVQSGVGGDFICQSRTDLNDVWVVKRKIFLNTYTIKT